MLFCSLNFIFIFLPLVIVLYYLLGAKSIKVKNIILLIFSLFFYAYGGVKFLSVMIASIIINYLGGLATGCLKKEFIRKFSLIVTIILNIGLLGYYKYMNFFIENINSLFKININIEKIILPIGISFFTFQGLSYVIDVYRKKVGVQKNPLIVALYISLFPQLIAGPIVTYETVEKELTDRKVTLDDMYYGIVRFIVGLGKKVLIANPTGELASIIFEKDPSNITTMLGLLGAIAFSFQIYFDFSGYSDMAIGLGRIFGFKFLENFNYPYISKTITDYWRRWHISLSTWFRDYVYIPLGGNKVSTIKHIRNLLIVWTITGFWHGASWNFVVWGLYFGIILIIEKYLLKNILAKIPKWLSHIYSIVLILIGWIIFNSPTLNYAFEYLKAIVTGNNGLINDECIHLFLLYKIELLIALIGCFPLYNFIKGKLSNKKMYGLVTSYLIPLFAFLVFGLSVVKLINNSFNPFIYFRF